MNLKKGLSFYFIKKNKFIIYSVLFFLYELFGFKGLF